MYLTQFFYGVIKEGTSYLSSRWNLVKIEKILSDPSGTLVFSQFRRDDTMKKRPLKEILFLPDETDADGCCGCP